ncbi:RDD family protein [Horticoccus sp. 23ND18S-11]|uniref:RDD family protein n=1 Tax=Horticoccus sp. 23ND18S-11 TaxID=3391832 RepID=UPI0039C9E5D9
MTTPFRFSIGCSLAALLVGLVPGVGAQEAPPAEPKPPVPVFAPAPAAGENAPAVPAVPAATAPAPETPAGAEPPLRRLDAPTPASPPPSPTPTPAPRQRRSEPRARSSSEFPIGSHVVPRDSSVREVVSVFGTSTIEGNVVYDVVSVLGDTFIRREAKVGRAAVAVLGRLENHGEVRRDTVSVLGASVIDGPVGGDAVSVLGNMNLGPNAVIGGDLVVVGGRLTRDPNAQVRGSEVHVPLFGGFGNTEWLVAWVKNCLVLGRPLAIGPHLEWAWGVALAFLGLYLLFALLFSRGIVACAETLETRPGSSVLTAFLSVLLTPVVTALLAITVVGALLVPFLGLALLVAKLFGMATMLAWIGRRFTRFFGDGPLSHPVFAVLIGGVITLLLYMTPIVGFLTFALFHWLGFGVVIYTVLLAIKRERRAAAVAAAASRPAPAPIPPIRSQAVTVPATFVPMAEAVPPQTVPPPVAGPAMGIVSAPTVSAGFGRAEPPAMEAVTPPAEVVPEPTGPVSDPGLPVTPPSPPPPMMASEPTASVPPFVPPAPPVAPPARPLAAPPAVALSASAWPRAGLFIRLGALAIDGVLIGMIMAFIAGVLPRFLQFHNGPGGWLIALALYGAIMWRHKGTTIGGIVCGLRVVRVDNRELDWATAIVRALACFLSLAVAGLGFIWVAFDDDKQSWHDKIAGTTVVLAPKGTSLL